MLRLQTRKQFFTMLLLLREFILKAVFIFLSRTHRTKDSISIPQIYVESIIYHVLRLYQSIYISIYDQASHHCFHLRRYMLHITREHPKHRRGTVLCASIGSQIGRHHHHEQPPSAACTADRRDQRLSLC